MLPAKVPIGILSRNRAVYLDATLRSLSASMLPSGANVTVYDDASDCVETRRYLDTAETFSVAHSWPSHTSWGTLGLDIVDNDPVLHGICERVSVKRVAESAVGVGIASSMAIRDLFARHKNAPAIILLQDDLLFNSDWYQRLVRQLGQAISPGGVQGLVAGCHLDWRLKRPINSTCIVREATAQCYLIARAGYEATRSWLESGQQPQAAFDSLFCEQLRCAGCEVQVLYPFVCQHIGVASLVRPNRRFYKAARAGLGRIGLGAFPPYCMAPEVRNFVN